MASQIKRAQKDLEELIKNERQKFHNGFLKHVEFRPNVRRKMIHLKFFQCKADGNV